jgi:hypothetical protein
MHRGRKGMLVFSQEESVYLQIPEADRPSNFWIGSCMRTARMTRDVYDDGIKEVGIALLEIIIILGS